MRLAHLIDLGPWARAVTQYGVESFARFGSGPLVGENLLVASRFVHHAIVVGDGYVIVCDKHREEIAVAWAPEGAGSHAIANSHRLCHVNAPSNAA
jgi:hypothetical protein